MAEKPKKTAQWTFLTNHAQVLLVVSQKPFCRMRDLAKMIGITERSVQGIVADLVEAGYLFVERKGRRNYYTVERNRPLRHPLEQHRSVMCLLQLILGLELDGRKGSKEKVLS